MVELTRCARCEHYIGHHDWNGCNVVVGLDEKCGCVPTWLDGVVDL